MACIKKFETSRLFDDIEKEVQMEHKKDLKEIRQTQRKLHGLQRVKEKMKSSHENQLEELTEKLEMANRERKNFERELVITKSDLAVVRRTLDLERQERKDSEERALDIIKKSKQKWENANKDKVDQLKKVIESQTGRITELCTSNNEMSSRLQRIECDFTTANAELEKLRNFEVEYKSSLTKYRKMNRDSQVGVKNELEQIATRAHNHLSELNSKLEMETARVVELESKLRHEQDFNHCCQSNLGLALELAQNDLKKCQEELRVLKATIPARDKEIDTLRSKLQEKVDQLDRASFAEKRIIELQAQVDRLKVDNDQLKQQIELLQDTKLELQETVTNMEMNEALAGKLERATEEKQILEERLKSTLQKEEEQGKKVGALEELVRRFEKSVVTLEAENNCLKTKNQSRSSLSRHTGITIEDAVRISSLEEQIENLAQQLSECREKLAAEEKAAKLIHRDLWKTKKELSDAKIDKRIADREKTTAEEKVKALQGEKLRLSERLNARIKEEEEKANKAIKELEEVKKSLADRTRDFDRLKIQADRNQKNLMQANEQIAELQSSSTALRRELDAVRKQLRGNQDRIDSIQSENSRLSTKLTKLNEEKNDLESKLEKMEQNENGYKVNIELLKETCSVLEEQLNDYEKLTSNHETRENILIQEKMKLQKDLEAVETKLRENELTLDKERVARRRAEQALESLQSDASDVEAENNVLKSRCREYKDLAQQLSNQLGESQKQCDNLRVELSRVKEILGVSKKEANAVKEESSQYLTRVYELKDTNDSLAKDLQSTVDQANDLRTRIVELEEVMQDMHQFYQEREIKAGSTCQQQTKLIDYLQSKFEEKENGKRKKTICDKIFGSKHKENIPPVNPNALPIGYRELENQLERERAKVKTLTEELISLKTTRAVSPLPASNPVSPEKKRIDVSGEIFARQGSMQRMRHNIPHVFKVKLPMRPGKCAACMDSIQFGKRAFICDECQTMAHLKCSVSVPANCGLPGGFARHLNSNRLSNNDNLSSLGGSVQTLAIDEPDCIPERDTDCQRKPANSNASMESWVKLPGRAKSCWEQSKSPSTCWPTSRLDIMALSQIDKSNWLKALGTFSSQCSKPEKIQTVVKLEKNQLDLNTVVELEDENILLFGAEEGLFSYQVGRSQCLTAIRGVKKVYQLTLHPQVGLAVMIAGEDRQLVSCDLRQLKSNAVAAECSRPAINTNTVLTGSDSCHLYQIHGEMLCAATANHVILLKWETNEESGEFISVRELETPEPCSCALFMQNKLIVGCHKFFQIDTRTYSIEEFPEEDGNSVKTTLCGVAKLGIFPVHVLDVSVGTHKNELLLCFNEFGVFVNENGQRTRKVDNTWSHLPFAFAFRKPYLFIIHFSSIEMIKLDGNSYKSTSTSPERSLIEINNPRYLGLAGPRGIYVTSTHSVLEILKIEGIPNLQSHTGSLTSLGALSQNDDSSSEFSFTSSLLEVLDGQGKKVQFAN
ncbi:hypothetical protein QAD02_015310 [Eretmocerus hayati]|uniref:Uncharacterized protein n=1 Tax=Eretmocerus hayati TaxID=131215 RepID=A0ACC2P7V9_9HYME|nr:hypothetical protein QAD02_015310 [Eretmocerus hayati]